MPQVDLIVMRLADMRRVHPDQDNSRACFKCGKQVGIYPSGQRVIAANPGIRILCQVCKGPHDFHFLAPGAEIEPFESNPAR